jgi:signal transduction histidine kinase/ligand-binding sensor domain-containing protein
MAQTPDGYLWLGTEFGLLRFDGVRTVPWQPPPGEKLRSEDVSALLASRDGSLWIGTGTELVSWKDGKLTRHQELDGQFLTMIFEDREGVIWAAGAILTGNGKLCAYRESRSECFGEDGSFGRTAYNLYEDHTGNLWVVSFNGLWRWRPGAPKLYPTLEPVSALAAVLDGEDGTLWIGMRGGIRRLIGDKPVEYRILGKQQFRPQRLFRDRGGATWIGTIDRGLLHYYQGKTDAFGRSDGLSSDSVGTIFEDHEGSVWVATNGGLDRFRDLPVTRFWTRQGLSNDTIGSVLGARDGSLWLASYNGLNRWKDSKLTIFRNQSSPREGVVTAGHEIVDPGLPSNGIESLFEDSRGRIWVSTPAGIAVFENGHFVRGSEVPRQVHTTVEDSRESLWVNDQDQGLVHLIQGRVTQRIPWTAFGQNVAVTDMIRDPVQGGLWFGLVHGGVVYFQDGKIRASHDAKEGVGAGTVNRLRIDPTGVLWAATEGGLSRFGKGRIDTLTSRNGLPCDSVQSMIEDDDRALWMSTTCGIVRIARSKLDAWVNDPTQRIQVTAFDQSDGAVSHPSSAGSYGPTVTKSVDGKLWFVVLDGVSVVDPRQLAQNKIPPPVHIEQVKADGKLHDATRGLRLPALARDLEIDYTALSLVAPEKNRFKYKLEGYDRDWRDAGNRRQAFYTNLSPRKYTFRVIGSNNDGVWNEAGTSFDFSTDPAYYQTTWFLASCLAAILALLWWLYRLRVQQLAQRLQIRMEERVNERTRVARDLHDTLLQSFQGVLLKFHAVTYMIPDRPEAQKRLDATIEEARQAIAEGRDAVQGLRSSTVITEDIARAITTFGEGLAAEVNGHHPPLFLVHVEGAPRDLAPLVRDEIYRIAGEALRNAFRHSGARRIEVDIHYDKRQLSVRVRDNGKGIDRHVLDAGGRAGHHGLPGMQERAQLVGGKLAIWSEVESGAEIELTINAAVAYAKSPAARRADQRS